MPGRSLFSLATLCLTSLVTATAQTPDAPGNLAEPWSKPLWAVHRGGQVDVPENTMIAIRHSVQLGARYLEIDLHATADGKIVLLHDEALARTTNGSGKVSERTWEQIKDLDAGSWKDSDFSHARIPLLSEVLGYCKQHGVRILLDIKSPDAAGASLYELLNQFDMVDDCRVYMRAGPSQPEVKAALDPRLTPFPGSLVQSGGAGTPREKLQRALDNPNSMGALVKCYSWVLEFYGQDD